MVSLFNNFMYFKIGNFINLKMGNFSRKSKNRDLTMSIILIKLLK